MSTQRSPYFPCCDNEVCVLDGTLTGSHLSYDSYWMCPGCGKLWNEWRFDARLDRTGKREPAQKRVEVYKPDTHGTIQHFLRSFVGLGRDE